jgi:exodeoxyribonuclease VII large subunit
VQNARTDLERIARRITQTAEAVVTRRKSLLGAAAGRLNALSPLNTLSRGYAVARDSKGKTLTSTGQFRAGLEFELLLHDGKVSAEATEVSPE